MDTLAFTLAHDRMNLPPRRPQPVTDPDHATDNHFDLRHRTRIERDACAVCDGRETTAQAASRLFRYGFDLSPHAQPNPAGPLDPKAVA